jgi:outer membrane protein OmpA-like peptidoglycan-associated protein
MSQETEFEVESELEQALEDALIRLEFEEESERNPVAELTTHGQRNLSAAFPQTIRETVSGFARYSNSIASLPSSERSKFQNIARLVVRSFGPGKRPIRRVRLIGHADRDIARERREPGFIRKMSHQRATAAKRALQRLIRNPSILARIRWYVSGAGASRLAVPNPRTESERARNRRVEIVASTEDQCAGWERDPESFSKRAAEHYLRKVWQPSFRVSITCTVPPPNWTCKVTVDVGAEPIILTVKLSPGDKLVRVARMPDSRTYLVCFYGYRCLPTGALILQKRACP